MEHKRKSSRVKRLARSEVYGVLMYLYIERGVRQVLDKSITDWHMFLDDLGDRDVPRELVEALKDWLQRFTPRDVLRARLYR